MTYDNNKIKDLRQAAKMTQQELADRLHVSTSTVSKWERGKSEPDIYMLKNIAELFAINMEELLGKNDSSNEVAEKNVLEEIDREAVTNREPSESAGNKIRKKGLLLKILLLPVGILAIVCFVIFYNHDTLKIVDEFDSDFSPVAGKVETYYIVVEYKGDITFQINEEFTAKVIEDKAQVLQSGQSIIIVYVTKYRDRENVLENLNIYGVINSEEHYLVTKVEDNYNE